MDHADVLFLHVPKLKNYYRPFHHFIWINFLPMGLLGLADSLHREGIATEVVHLGVELIEDPHFSILDYVRHRGPRVVAMDLHWHHQIFDAMELAKKLKAEFPHLFLLLGGFTASFFHEEIMKNFDTVDGVIRGEAEVPLLELVRALLRKEEDLFSIPNLTWRRKGKILVNPLSYVASEEDLNRLSFNNFSLLKNYPTYIRYIGQPFYVTGISKEKNFFLYSRRSPVYHLTVGRGCPTQCTWCSGNIPSQMTVTGRREVTYRGTEEVLQTIQEAISYGYETFHICFDPSPEKAEYFVKLFARIRDEGLKMECCFESFGLPTPELAKSFKDAFPGPRSSLILSPDVGSDRLRKIHKGYSYSNRALMDCLDHLERQGIFFDVFFTIGVPFETAEDLEQTLLLQKRIRSCYRNLRGIRTYTIEMEPGSPWQIDPEAFGVETRLKGFIDYYHYHSGNENVFSSLGYWLPSSFLKAENEVDFERKLQEIKCRNFCFLHPDVRRSSTPFWGRRFCDLSSLFWKVKGLTGRKIP